MNTDKPDADCFSIFICEGEYCDHHNAMGTAEEWEQLRNSVFEKYGRLTIIDKSCPFFNRITRERRVMAESEHLVAVGYKEIQFPQKTIFDD